jgi:ATP-binding cassette subfamily C protein
VAIAGLVSSSLAIFIGRYHWVLGAIAALGYLFVGAVLPLILSKLNREIGAAHRKESGALSGFVLDSLRGLRETIQFGAGQKRLAAMNARTDALAEKSKKLKAYEGIGTAVSGGAILFFSASILLTALGLYQGGRLESEAVLIAAVAAISSFGPAVALANLGSSLTHTFAAANRILDILDETPAAGEVCGGTAVDFTGASCENLCFAYDEEPVLSAVNMDFPQNAVIGISGKSGSGKSTLLRLLMRFWDADSGRVNISGENIRRINTKNLREMEGLVTQDTQIFNDTIENNIKIARPDATREQVADACQKAALHAFIRTLPKGYDTAAGELGDSLSGGERQRIGLARAFLHDAPFLLLDEPTSNLDSLNEAVILCALQEQRAGKTVVLVSHRKSAMGIAGRVFTVENGRFS